MDVPTSVGVCGLVREDCRGTTYRLIARILYRERGGGYH